MPLLPGLKVIRSNIHGYGIVTTKPFYQGDLLLYGDGVLWREAEEFDDTYALVLPGYETAPDGTEGPALYWDLACQSRWINHSCDPNTEVDTWWNDKTQIPRAWWRTTRDIPVGEELTYDYAFSGHLAEPCFCQTSICRGVIADPDELHLVPEKFRHLIKVPITPPKPVAIGEQPESAAATPPARR